MRLVPGKKVSEIVFEKVEADAEAGKLSDKDAADLVNELDERRRHIDGAECPDCENKEGNQDNGAVTVEALSYLCGRCHLTWDAWPL